MFPDLIKRKRYRLQMCVIQGQTSFIPGTWQATGQTHRYDEDLHPAGEGEEAEGRG